MNNLRFAIAYLVKRRGGNLIRLASLALGLTVGLLIFSYVNFTLTFDRFFPDRDRIYQIWTTSSSGLSDCMLAPLAPALADELAPVEAATRLRGGFQNQLYRGDEPFDCRFMAIDTCFFDVLDFGMVRGDATELTGKERILLSESTARRIFGDRDPMGERLMMKNTVPMTVVGIFRDPPLNNSLGRFDALVSLDYIVGSYRMDWGGGDSFPSYLKLREGASVAEIEAAMSAFDARHGQTEYNAQWNLRYLFVPIAHSATTDSAVVQVAWILSALALLILFVATMNYVLVSVSALVDRARTVAMLRCHGARRADVAAIFLWETAALIGASLVVAGFVIWALQQQIGQLMGVPVGELFAPARIWVPACVTVTTLLAAGVLPAAAFASVPLATAFRGGSTGRRGWKRALLFVQIASVTLALTALAVFSLQVRHLRQGDMGFDVRRTVSVMPVGTRTMFRNMAEAFAAMPEVEAAGWTSTPPVWGYSGQPCYDETTHELLFGCRLTWIDEYYIDAIGMRLVAGRTLTAQSRPDEALVNERYCALRGWTPEEAVGRTVSSSGSADDPWTHTIVGVVKDFRTLIESGETQPILMVSLDEYMSDPDANYGGMRLCIRLREVTPEALDAVRAKLKEYRTADNERLVLLGEELDASLATEIRIRRIAAIVGLVVLLIALVGLVGYLGDETRSRSREVAIRKVNGAADGDILGLLTRNLAAMTVPAVAAGIALAYVAMTAVLSNFASRIALGWQIFAGVALLLAAIVGAVLLLRTRRIVRANPVEMIKTE